MQGWGDPWTKYGEDMLVPPAVALAQQFGGEQHEVTWLYCLVGVLVVAPVLVLTLGLTGLGQALVLLGASHGLGWYLHQKPPTAADDPPPAVQQANARPAAA